MFIAWLVLILSNPGEPVVFGVLRDDFKSRSDCIQYVANLEVPEEVKSKLRCLPIMRPVEI